MKKLKNRFIRFGTPILCLLLLLGAVVVLFSACNDIVSTEPESQLASSISSSENVEEQDALHFDVQNVTYYYVAPIRISEDQRDVTDYFEEEGRDKSRLLVNALTSIDNYYDLLYKEKMSSFTELTVFDKTYPLSDYETCYAMNDYWAGEDLGNFAYPIYSYYLSEYLPENFEESKLDYFEVELYAPDGRLRSVTLPAEEISEEIPATKDLTAEEGTQYAKEILADMGYSVEDCEASVFDNAENDEEGGRTLLRVRFTDKSLGNASYGYTVEFRYDDLSSYHDQVKVTIDRPDSKGVPALEQMLATPDYERKAPEDALTFLATELKDESYLDRIELGKVVTTPRADGTVSVMVHFFDKEATERKDLWDSPFDIAVQLIVEP